MKCLITFFGLVLLATMALSVQGQDKPVFCYWGTWSHYRTGNGQYRPEHIDGSLCTHIMYAFFGISTDGRVLILDSWLDLNLQNIQKTVALKSKWPHLKVIASVGGWNEGSTKFSTVARSQQLRDTFASNVLGFVQMYGFDGIDIDWEYPVQRGGIQADKANFILFMEAIYKKLKPAGYEVMIATSCAEDSVRLSYDLPKLHPFLDYLLIMSYDLHGSWDGVTGHNAPLYPGPTDISIAARKLNVDASVKYFLSQGFPKSKLVVGIPLYGRTFVLRNSGVNGVAASISGVGPSGPFTQTGGHLGYLEICDRMKANGYTRVWDSASKVPYAFSGNNWISYDDVESVTIKAQYAKDLGLAGVMVWSIETEDARGACGERYSLLKAINAVVRNGDPPPTTTSTTTTTTTTVAPETTTKNPNTAPCATVPAEWRDNVDCTKYFRCIYVNFPPVRMTCPDNLYYDEVRGHCNYPADVDCVQGK